MPAVKRRQAKRPLAHRIGAGLALICYLATATGFPLPTSAGKSDGQRFPCQDHPCGCATAEQCWAHCCCFTAEERWAWARTHDIEPPAYAERPQAGGWCTTRQRDQCADEQHGTCRHCDQAGASPVVAKKPCCTSHEPAAACCREKTAGSAKPSRAASKGRWLDGYSSLKCRGGASQWVSAGGVAPPPSALNWQPYLLVVDRLSYASDNAAVHTLLPPEPPPRMLHVA